MYDDYLDELLEEAYLEGYYDSIDDYNDYYNESRAIGREWLRLHDNAKIANAAGKDPNLPDSLRRRYQDDEYQWERKRDSIHTDGVPSILADGLRGIGSSKRRSNEYDKASYFKDKMGRRTYKDREPGYYLKLQGSKEKI